MIAGVTAALLAVILVFSVPAAAISARSYVLLDAATGRILDERLPDQKSLIASTTKIMTALVVCEQCNVLDRVRIPKAAVGVEGSSMYLQEGEILTVQELLYGMMLRSGNDAATALAIYCGGTVEGFAQLMNDKARTLGLKNTHFENPHGLDGVQHFSTAEDLARLSAYAMNNPIFAKIVSTKTTRVGQRQLTNHNKLLWQVEGADGVKTGFTKAAGRILASSAQRNGRRLVAVTIHAPDDWNDHAVLLNKGFSRYHPSQIVKRADVLGLAEIAGGQEKAVQLIAKDDFFYPLAKDENVEIFLPQPEFVYAPVVYGQDAGFAYLSVNGHSIGRVALMFGQTVEQETAEKDSVWKRIFGG